MRISNLPSAILLLPVALFFYVNVNAQQANVNIEQSEKITKLMKVKTEMNKDNKIGDRYVIQLYYGDNQKASEVIKEYRGLYAYPSKIEYEAPNFKVWIGRFRNRLEADRALLKLKENFPAAFIPKLQRR